MTITSLLVHARKTLVRAGVPSPDVDAETLVGHVLGIRRGEIYLRAGGDVTPEERSRIMDLVRRRAARMPLQYLLGECEFMSLPFKVTEGVFIPRPETEVLIEVILRRARDLKRPVRRILDIGTGCGVVGISLARHFEPALVLVTDITDGAVEISKANAILNRVERSVCYAIGDRLEFLRGGLVKGFDVVACNPPYVESAEIPGLEPEIRDHEPRIALDGGPDGLRFIDGLAGAVPSILSEGGLAAFEIGAGQGKRVKALFEEVGLEGVEVVKDLAGLDRVVAGRRP